MTMKRKRKRQPRCRSIRDYKQILFILNPNSVAHFGDHGWTWMGGIL